MSNFRLFCVAFVATSAMIVLSELFGAPSPPPLGRMMICLNLGITAVAFAGDRPARKIVEGR